MDNTGIYVKDVRIRTVSTNRRNIVVMDNRVLAKHQNINENAFINEQSVEFLEKLARIQEVIISQYPNGVIFSPMSNRLLEAKSGVALDEKIIAELQKQMFRRLDDVWLFPEMLTSEKIQYQIVNTSIMWLAEFDCFSITALSQQVAFEINNLSDVNKEFENFLLFLMDGQSNAPQFKPRTWNGVRIARSQGVDLSFAMERLGHKIEAAIDIAGGIVTETELLMKIPVLDAALLSAVVKDFLPHVLKTEINGLICFSHVENLGLPDDFSTQLSETVLQLETLNLDVSDTVLHTALSLVYGVNFNNAYQISDKKTFRNIVTQYFKGEKPHAWSRGAFSEVRV